METPILPSGLTAQEVQAAVQKRYSEVGTNPSAGYNFKVGRSFAIALGYPASVVDDLPPSVAEAFTGVAAPSLIAEVQPGDTVVDLGCGAGLDLVLLSRKAGPTGHVIGIDFAAGMVERARANLALLGLDQTEVRHTVADATGLPDATVDWVVANGILNLSPDKAAVIEEVARILRPGGYFLLAETTLRAPLAPGAVSDIDDWFR